MGDSGTEEKAPYPDPQRRRRRYPLSPVNLSRDQNLSRPVIIANPPVDGRQLGVRLGSESRGAPNPSEATVDRRLHNRLLERCAAPKVRGERLVAQPVEKRAANTRFG